MFPDIERKPKPRKSNDVGLLVEVWKDLEGIRQQSPEGIYYWNKMNYGKHSMWCKALLIRCGSLDRAADCIEDMVGYFRGLKLNYTLATVARWADKWMNGEIKKL